jgi:hypothetical protein
VIVTAGKSERLPVLLAALVPGVVESVIREVVVVEQGPPEALAALCDATGAGRAADFAQAVAQARGEWLLVVPPELRLKEGWVERFADHLRQGAGEARVSGLAEGLFRPGARGLIVSRAKAQLAQAGLQQLARQLGRGARRLG